MNKSGEQLPFELILLSTAFDTLCVTVSGYVVVNRQNDSDDSAEWQRQDCYFGGKSNGIGSIYIRWMQTVYGELGVIRELRDGVPIDSIMT